MVTTAIIDSFRVGFYCIILHVALFGQTDFSYLCMIEFMCSWPHHDLHIHLTYFAIGVGRTVTEV